MFIVTSRRGEGRRSEKHAISILLLSFCVFQFALPRPSHAESWQELSGEHFIVYHRGEDKFAKDVLDKAEVYYERIASDLGYPRYSEFWTWDRRVKIYIHPDHASYIKATGQPQWSKGMADYTNKQIVSFVWSQGFLDSLLPHEVAHLIFRDFVGFKGETPLWLDEGIAQWEEAAKRDALKFLARQFYEKDSLLSLQDMMTWDIKALTDPKRVYIRPTITKDGEKGILFLSSKSFVDTYYLQAASIVGFLMEKQGSSNFAEFCRQLRDGKSMDEALSFAYPTSTRSVSELEDQWRRYLRDTK